ncbi:MAG: SpaA isopeptide-forming pilin-related protein [Coriobacteriia bacterium]|nr:SpaA isopeptide-forming pilin-related protein [Coriobacteriia bacterium]
MRRARTDINASFAVLPIAGVRRLSILCLTMILAITAAMVLPTIAVATMPPASITIQMTSAPRFHSTAFLGRWIASDGMIVYCLEQGFPFAAGSTHTRSSNPVSDNRVRGIMTYGFPNQSASALAARAGVSSLTRTEAQMATQHALWSLGWGGGIPRSVAPEFANGPAGVRVLAAARWLVTNASSSNSATFGDFWTYSSGRTRHQTMIHPTGAFEDPATDVALIKRIAPSRVEFIPSPTTGLIDPQDGYIYYGPMTDARFVLHAGTSAENARQNALSNNSSTRIGTYNLARGTMRDAIGPCPETGPNFSDWFTSSQIEQLAESGITRWTDRIAYLAIDDTTQSRDLNPGWHAFTETRVPVGYLPRDETASAVNLRAGETGIALFSNIPIAGHIEIRKETSNQTVFDSHNFYTLAGAQFEIRDALRGNRLLGTITTNAQGIATTRQLDMASMWFAQSGQTVPPGLPLGRYTITEVTPPRGHTLSENRTQNVRLSSARMTSDETVANASVTFTNDPIIFGRIDIEKQSANTDITNGNDLYSFAGAHFEVRGPAESSTANTVIGTFVTNAQGRASSQSFDLSRWAIGGVSPPGLPLGTYSITEVRPPMGYALDSSLRQATLCIEQMNPAGTLAIASDSPSNLPQVNSADLLLRKVDSETGLSEPQGAATLAGARFRINFYPGPLRSTTNLDWIDSTTAMRTWYVLTDEKGQASLKSDSLETNRSSPVWTDSQGRVALPLGTVTIQEVRPPAGYVINDDIFAVHIIPTGTDEIVKTYIAPTVKQQVIRGDFAFNKIFDRSHGRVGNIPFTITSLTTGETATIITNQNGEASTCSAERPRTGINPWTEVNRRTRVNAGELYTDGVWLGLMSEITDSKGALIYDTYQITEIEVAENAGMEMLDIQIRVSHDGHRINGGTFTNRLPDPSGTDPVRPNIPPLLPTEVIPRPSVAAQTPREVVAETSEEPTITPGPETGDSTTAVSALMGIIASLTAMCVCSYLLFANRKRRCQ